MSVPENLLYTKEHEWVLIEGNKGKIGITDYAQTHLGDVTYIDMPSTGKELKQFESMTSVESVKASSDIYAPLSGKITQVNPSLESNPEILNQSPYENGWVAVLEIKDESEKSNLMDSKRYKAYIEGLG